MSCPRYQHLLSKTILNIKDDESRLSLSITGRDGGGVIVAVGAVIVASITLARVLPLVRLDSISRVGHVG